jgi:hypothetical protein
MGYITRLFSDFVDKVPQISVRANTPWVGPRVIPSPAALKYWHSQAVRNGTRLFFHWIWDYRSDDEVARKDEDSRGGLMVRTLDKSTLPELRFNTLFDISRKLGQANVFVPPASKTGVFVSLDTNFIEREGWLSNMAIYIELAQAGVWVNFVSDQELREGTENLDQFEVLYLPMVKFARPEQIKAISEFIRNGGTVITADTDVFAYDDWGKPTENLRKRIFGVVDVSKRMSKENTIRLKGAFSGMTIEPYLDSYEIKAGEDAEIIGVYPDGKAAAVVRTLGKGKAYFFGGNILDVYFLQDKYSDQKRDSGRDQFYKSIERRNGCEDLSWIWDINVDNVVEVTGKAEIELPAIDKSVTFD